MKFFIGDKINFEYGFNRKTGKVIGLTQKGFPLVKVDGFEDYTIIPSFYSYEDLVFLEKSKNHIKWDLIQRQRKNRPFIQKITDFFTGK